MLVEVVEVAVLVAVEVEVPQDVVAAMLLEDVVVILEWEQMLNAEEQEHMGYSLEAVAAEAAS